MGNEDLIFLADNDPQTSSQHCRVLEQGGYRVKRFSLDALSSTINGTLQGIVVLNLGSNVKAGLEAQQQLVADGRVWQVIFIADCDQIPEAVRAIKAGAIDFHVTPNSPGKLLQSVQEVLVRLYGLFTVRAYGPEQPLGDHADQTGRNLESFDPHVHQASDRRGRRHREGHTCQGRHRRGDNR